ncbi:MAG: type II toxin-antitoxin system RelE/ParE family toxin [Gammaproteobacteria bacterium]|jgi:proteic killer suppression protein
MIRTWKHKGLRNFFESGSIVGIQIGHVRKLKIILQQLNAAIQPEDMNTPNMNFHKLSGNLKNFYSVSVNKNWRVIFKFDGRDAILVDYYDYH